MAQRSTYEYGLSAVDYPVTPAEIAAAIIREEQWARRSAGQMERERAKALAVRRLRRQEQKV